MIRSLVSDVVFMPCALRLVWTIPFLVLPPLTPFHGVGVVGAVMRRGISRARAAAADRGLSPRQSVSDFLPVISVQLVFRFSSPVSRCDNSDL